MKSTIFVVWTIFTSLSSFAQCIPSAVRTPASVADNAAIGTLTWQNLTNVLSSNNSRATAVSLNLGTTQTSHYMMSTNFGFSIPTAAVICGIVVEIEQSYSGISIGSSIRDNTVRLLLAGALSGNNLRLVADWPTTEAYRTYGSNSNTWGLTLTPADINNTNFGVAISADLVSGLGLPTANIDHVRMTVYYNATLPVTWTRFAGAPFGNHVRLNWSTADETGNHYFVIERSLNDLSWLPLDTVKGTSGAGSYQWEDGSPRPFSYYRIRQVDLDGRVSFSKTISVKYTPATSGLIRVNSVSADRIAVQSREKIAQVQLFDMQGRIQPLRYLTRSDLYQELSTSHLAGGAYIVRVVTSHNSYTTKIVK